MEIVGGRCQGPSPPEELARENGVEDEERACIQRMGIMGEQCCQETATGQPDGQGPISHAQHVCRKGHVHMGHGDGEKRNHGKGVGKDQAQVCASIVGELGQREQGAEAAAKHARQVGHANEKRARVQSVGYVAPQFQ